MINIIITLIIWMIVVILITAVIAFIANITQDYYNTHRAKKKNKLNKKLDN